MVISNRPVVGIAGMGGNLGTVVAKLLIAQDSYEVVRIGWHRKQEEEFNFHSEKRVITYQDRKLDLIINLANYYNPNPIQDDLPGMKSAITGIAESICQAIAEWRVPVISASSYFQFCPKHLAPWSEYAIMKQKAQDRMIDFAEKYKTPFSDFILFDNYGGNDRGKFLDKLIEATFKGNIMSATKGQQVLNLTHVKDQAEAFSDEVAAMLSNKSGTINIFELRSKENYTLVKLAELVQKVSGRKLIIEWGSIPYRTKEVFEIWPTGYESPPNWSPSTLLEEYLKNLFEEKAGAIS